MAGWGLLQGLGRGISQGAEIMSRGMSEDREAERQRMREASIEKRWKKQEAKEDARYADAQKRQTDQDAKSDERYNSEKQYREQRDKKTDGQFNEHMGLRRVQQIESNLSGLMQSQDAAEAKTVEKYREQIMSGTGDPEALQKQMEAEVKALRQQYGDQINNYVKSYGNQLKGTGFEYMLALPDTQTNLNNAGTKTDSGPVGNGFDRNSYLQKIIGDSGSAIKDVANQWENQAIPKTVGQKGVEAGLLNQKNWNKNLSGQDIGQLSSFISR